MEIAGVVPLAKLAKFGGKAIQKVAKTVSAVCSFDGSTLVLTKFGKKPIRAILPRSDRVWGLDATGKGDWHLVTSQTVATYDHKVLVTTRIPLAFLAPKLQAAILDGRQPVQLSLAQLIRDGIPMDWSEQAHLFGMA